jgi:sterol desaturase/sphingolipid hydroxylase (fatty acid hydroxylase superfamily)
VYRCVCANHAARLLGKTWIRFRPGCTEGIERGLATFCLALGAAYGIEIFYIGYSKSSLRMLLKWDKQIRYDLFFTLLPLTPIYALVWYCMTLGTTEVDWPWMAYVKNTFPIAAIAIFPLQLVAVVLVSSFLQYWQHRFIHNIPILWETHKFHHSAQQMTTLSLSRETPFTVVLNGMLIAIPTAIVGSYLFPAAQSKIDYVALFLYIGYQTFHSLNQFLIHSNLNISYGWFGRYFMVSPANHRVHHSILPEHWDKNFSASLVLWDRVFGTYHEGTDSLSQNCPVGYEGNIYNKNKWIVFEYLYPTFAFFTAIYAGLANCGRRLGRIKKEAR